MTERETYNLGNYLLQLEEKGFKFGEDAISFIYFGKQFTKSSDHIVTVCIELTLKFQKSFDASFYLSLLETMKTHDVQTRKRAYELAEQLGFLGAKG
ncbi:DUF6123 family protein [Bacillus niameyensis]|uniref:DUF6123 family protein n=1 Tax=Bacillus niameyensis TaxID=1522308 RepID=UPI001E4E6790|nr:DUF6123 family protein [Bacillus niameyensis]